MLDAYSTVKRHSAEANLNLGMEQHSTNRNQYTNPFYTSTIPGSPSC